MSRIAYVNGRYVPKADAAVHVEDRGFLFGDGIYEVIHFHQGKFVDAALHLDRMDRSMAMIELTPPMSRAAMLCVLKELIRRNRAQHGNGMVYMQVTRGTAPRDHAFPTHPVAPTFVAMVKRIGAFPTDVDAWTGTLISHPDLRWARRDIKTVNLLANCLAKQAARSQGAYEALLYDEATGLVTEGSSTSFWIVDADGVLRTRPLGHEILPGCTRAALIEELTAAGIPHDERPFALDEVRNAQEAFLTSATSFVKPMLALDGAAIGDGKVGPVSRRLFALFSRHVLGAPRNA